VAQVAVNQASSLDPVGDARHWVKSIDTSRGFLFLFGGLKSHIEALLEKGPKDLILFVLEPDRFLAYQHERVLMFHTLEDLGRSFPVWDIRRKGFKLASIPSYRLLYPKLYRDWVMWMEKQAAATAVDLVTSHRFSREWQKNTLENMVWLKKAGPVSDLFGKWQKKPFVIVSAGPSLDTSLDELRKAQGRAFIVAAGTTAPILQREGIEPSMYIAFDAGLANWRAHFRGLKIKAPLLFDLMVHPFCLQDHFGPKTVMQIWPFEYLAQALQYDLGIVRVGPSVANSAMRLGVRMGASPIILVGQDLGFRSGRYHAKGTHQTIEAVPIPDIRAKIPAVGGGTIETTLTMQTFFWNFCEIVSTNPGRYINASFGAKIPGTEDMPLSEVVDSVLTTDYSRELAILKCEKGKFNLLGLADELQKTIDVSVDLLKNTEKRVLSNYLNTRALNPLSFILSPIWSHPRCDEDWGYEKTREELGWVLPILRKTVEELRA